MTSLKTMAGSSSASVLKELEKLGAGAFLAVAQGNDDDSASIVRLRYLPAAKNLASRPQSRRQGHHFRHRRDQPEALPCNARYAWRHARQRRGGRDSIGYFRTETSGRSRCLAGHHRKPYRAVSLQITGPGSCSANGKTIQTIHTDAEGRMALADTLVLQAVTHRARSSITRL